MSESFQTKHNDYWYSYILFAYPKQHSVAKIDLARCVSEYIQCFNDDCGRTDHTERKSKWWHFVIVEQYFVGKIQNDCHTKTDFRLWVRQKLT